MTAEGQKPARSLNIRDIAKLAGVSYQTVSRVLNDSPSIRPETRQRVLDVIEQTGFRPNQAARALVTSKTGTIGVLVASQDASYGIQTMTYAVEAAAREAGYRVSITSCASDDASVHEALDRLVQQAVEAVVVVAPQVRVFRAMFAASLRVPFVTLDSTRRDIGHSISVDQFAGARLATSHLIELGHERIIHLAGPQDWIEAEARMQGYLFELTERDLPVTPPILGDWTADFGYRAGVELLWRRDFTAVFAASDLMALGLLHAFREAGVDVPGEVSIVGFDDIPESAHFWPPLTTIRQNFAETGRRAVGLLVAELRSERVAQPSPIQPELVVRDTTAHAP
ncbi:DNA-binding LacI/PurR family transcriptional regulator [Diaminobutyricimonas aerilata]|uniref:DNA-binding LacI/PurR family transcriptional regulator n=1 Tax=Diaminobutyricimonas aerilata TaxID=1162967 RepID=A0A2M9CGP9_9MICO|nr:LacI family DNA-binding transcriptional regulator [Diaminobutyricimonas aerilata]PJJ71059.1 DNA-binding LacI/PurR family transcriptional regulator [Diaminobutyricimonas aerilata]